MELSNKNAQIYSVILKYNNTETDYYKGFLNNDSEIADLIENLIVKVIEDRVNYLPN
jgi:hypothetical protein